MSYLKRLPARELLTAARTYYVATTGNDANDGLAVGTPFLTIQKAIDTVASVDTAIYGVTIQIADGTYTAAGLVLKQMTGAGTLTIQGNAGTPANVSVVSNSDSVVTLSVPGSFVVKDFQLSTTGAGSNLLFVNQGILSHQNLNFGSATANNGTHVYAVGDGKIVCTGGYTISGGGYAHFRSAQLGWLSATGLTLTISAAVTFTVFAVAQYISWATAWGLTFVNPLNVTAQRYLTEYNSVLYSGGGGANYFPGNVAGVAANGGYYL